MRVPSDISKPSGEGRFAFTLIELLVVMALIGILVAAMTPAMSSFSRSGRIRQNLIDVSGALEKAREYAVSKGTYTWVAWRTNGAPATPIIQITFASADGSKANVPANGSYSGGYGGTNRLIVLDRPRQLEQCAFKSEAGLPSESPIRLRVEDATVASGVTGPGFSGYSHPRMGTIDFDASVMFTPSGEARVSAALPENIRLVVVPVKGGNTEDPAEASLVQVSGLTGRVKVYRP